MKIAGLSIDDVKIIQSGGLEHEWSTLNSWDRGKKEDEEEWKT